MKLAHTPSNIDIRAAIWACSCSLLVKMCLGVIGGWGGGNWSCFSIWALFSTKYPLFPRDVWQNQDHRRSSSGGRRHAAGLYGEGCHHLRHSTGHHSVCETHLLCHAGGKRRQMAHSTRCLNLVLWVCDIWQRGKVAMLSVTCSSQRKVEALRLVWFRLSARAVSMTNVP